MTDRAGHPVRQVELNLAYPSDRVSRRLTWAAGILAAVQAVLATGLAQGALGAAMALRSMHEESPHLAGWTLGLSRVAETGLLIVGLMCLVAAAASVVGSGCAGIAVARWRARPANARIWAMASGYLLALPATPLLGLAFRAAEPVEWLMLFWGIGAIAMGTLVVVWGVKAGRPVVVRSWTEAR